MRWTGIPAVAREDNKRENQHYLPKVLLRNFAEPDEDPRNEKIWVLDKSNSSTFRTNLRNIAAECGFYQIDGDNDSISTERVLSELEAHAAQVLRKIIKRRGLHNLSANERRWLSIFCAVQFIRVPNVRERQRSLSDSIERRIVESGGDINTVDGYKPMTAKDLKEFAIGLIQRAAKDFSPHFANKVCFLLETHMGDPFFVSDNPISLHNENDFRPYGNLGLAVRGIEIYFPITPTLTLTFWDTSVPERILTWIAAFRARFERKETETSLRTRLRSAEELISAAQTGGVSRCSAEVVMFLNSLQVIGLHPENSAEMR